MKRFLFTLVLSVFSVQANAENLIVNGGFEASTDNTTTPPGWTNIGHEEGVIAYSEFGTPAYEGLYFYDLGGFGDSSGPVGDGIMQDVVTNIGSLYVLEFGLTSENGVSAPDTTLTVCLNLFCSDFTQSVDNVSGSLGKPFVTETIFYTATSALTTISFVESVNPGVGSNDPMIDNVIFTVPPFIGRLPATPGGSDYQAYYDEQLDITWTADANINGTDTWANQVAWAAGVTIAGATGWRLPSMDVNGDNSVVNCSSSTQEACQDNEYGHLFYYGAGTTLGGGVTPASQEPFSNVQSGFYWSGTELSGSMNSAWLFAFGSGGQSGNDKNIIRFAWAVYDGDVDSDADGIPNVADNCTDVPNPGQQDTNGDNYGNACDPDLNNDNVVDFGDLPLLQSSFFAQLGDNNFNPDADANSDNVVDFADLPTVQLLFFQPPGPSGLVP